MTHEEIDEFERNNPKSSRLSEICRLARLGLTAQDAVSKLFSEPQRPGRAPLTQEPRT